MLYLTNMNNLQLVAPSLIPMGVDCALDVFPLYKLAVAMEFICVRENGIGLSAVQLGVPLNFFIIKFPEGFCYYLNCQYTSIDGEKEKSLEGCLSLKTADGQLRWFEVERFKNIVVKGKQLVCDPVLSIIDIEVEFRDIMSVVFQHEIQHQNKVLISDVGKEVFLWR